MPTSQALNISISPLEATQTPTNLMRAIATAQLAQARGAGGGGGGGRRGSRSGDDEPKYRIWYNPVTGEAVPIYASTDKDFDRNVANYNDYVARSVIYGDPSRGVAPDAGLQERLAGLADKSVEAKAEAIQDIRKNYIPQLAARSGVEESALLRHALGRAEEDLATERKAIQQQSTLGTFLDSARIGFRGFTDDLHSLFASADEQMARATETQKYIQDIQNQNAFLRNRARRTQEGAGFFDRVGNNFIDEMTATVGEFAGQNAPLFAGGYIGGLAGRGAVAASRLARGVQAAEAGTAAAARAATISNRAALGGTMLGSATVGAPMQYGAVARSIINDPNLTDEQKAQALEDARAPALATGAALSSVTMPFVAPARRALAHRFAQAGRGRSNLAQVVRAERAANGNMPRLADNVTPAMLRTRADQVAAQMGREVDDAANYWARARANARAADIAAENARISSLTGRYTASLGDTAMEGALLGGAMNTATNVIAGETTGREYDPYENLGAAVLAGVAASPLLTPFNMRPYMVDQPLVRAAESGRAIQYQPRGQNEVRALAPEDDVARALREQYQAPASEGALRDMGRIVGDYNMQQQASELAGQRNDLLDLLRVRRDLLNEDQLIRADAARAQRAENLQAAQAQMQANLDARAGRTRPGQQRRAQIAQRNMERITRARENVEQYEAGNAPAPMVPDSTQGSRRSTSTGRATAFRRQARDAAAMGREPLPAERAAMRQGQSRMNELFRSPNEGLPSNPARDRTQDLMMRAVSESDGDFIASVDRAIDASTRGFGDISKALAALSNLRSDFANMLRRPEYLRTLAESGGLRRAQYADDRLREYFADTVARQIVDVVGDPTRRFYPAAPQRTQSARTRADAARRTDEVIDSLAQTASSREDLAVLHDRLLDIVENPELFRQYDTNQQRVLERAVERVERKMSELASQERVNALGRNAPDYQAGAAEPTPYTAPELATGLRRTVDAEGRPVLDRNFKSELASLTEPVRQVVRIIKSTGTGTKQARAAGVRRVHDSVFELADMPNGVARVEGELLPALERFLEASNSRTHFNARQRALLEEAQATGRAILEANNAGRAEAAGQTAQTQGRAEEILANSTGAGEGVQPTAGLGRPDDGGTGRTPDADLAGNSGRTGTDETGAATSAGTTYGRTPASGEAAPERGNAGAEASGARPVEPAEGTVGAEAGAAEVGTVGERGTVPTTPANAEGSASAGGTGTAGRARSGDDGNVADTGSNAESGDVARAGDNVVEQTPLVDENGQLIQENLRPIETPDATPEATVGEQVVMSDLVRMGHEAEMQADANAANDAYRTLADEMAAQTTPEMLSRAYARGRENAGAEAPVHEAPELISQSYVRTKQPETPDVNVEQAAKMGATPKEVDAMEVTAQTAQQGNVARGRSRLPKMSKNRKVQRQLLRLINSRGGRDVKGTDASPLAPEPQPRSISDGQTAAEALDRYVSETLASVETAPVRAGEGGYVSVRDALDRIDAEMPQPNTKLRNRMMREMDAEGFPVHSSEAFEASLRRITGAEALRNFETSLGHQLTPDRTGMPSDDLMDSLIKRGVLPRAALSDTQKWNILEATTSGRDLSVDDLVNAYVLSNPTDQLMRALDPENKTRGIC